MISKLKHTLVVTVLLLGSSIAFAGLDRDIKVVIEEPAVGESYSGVTNLRGWVVSPAGIGRYALEVYIDGEFAFYVPVGGNRPDVAENYSNYPSSDQSGFSMAFNYKSLSPGTHEIKVRAFDNVDNYNDAWVSFATERFKSVFIADESEIDLSTTETWAIVNKQTYSVSGATVEGQKWDFLLSWDTASQSFKTENIRTSSAQGGGNTLAAADDSSGGGNTGAAADDSSGGGYTPADDSSGGGYTPADDSSGGGYQGPTNAACGSVPNADRSNASIIEMDNGLQLANHEDLAFSYLASRQYYDVTFRSQAGDWYMIVNGERLISIEVIREQDTCNQYPTLWVTGVSSDAQGNLLLEFEDLGVVATVDSSCAIGVGSGLATYETPSSHAAGGYSPSTASKQYVVDLATVDVCEVIAWSSF